MKKSKWRTRYTITFSNGEKITTTGSMFNDMSIAYRECAKRMISLGCEAIAKEYSNMSEEIYNYLESKGYYED